MNKRTISEQSFLAQSIPSQSVSLSLCGLAEYFYASSENEENLMLDSQASAFLSYLLCELALRAVDLEEQQLSLKSHHHE